MQLGKLKEIDIRKVWQHEQYDFSKWLSSENNLKELGDILNLSLTDVETEKFVGNYRCDILCKDEITGKVVLIENQLEPSNHDHLGKIITYSSGLDASVVVWIVQNAREEHASAIEWLNKHTDDDVSFFLVEIHAYKIGDSEPAPQFKIIEQPNDFVKSVKAISKNSDISDTEKKRLEFWTQFNEVLEEYKKCDIVNLPSFYEGFGMPIIEGQTVGRAVVTSNLQPMVDIANGSCVIVDPSDLESMREGYQEAIDNYEYYVKRGIENSKRFSIDNIVGQYIEVYKRIK